jgi:signal transduction histidine kinase/CheY-like chemotaxis protein
MFQHMRGHLLLLLVAVLASDGVWAAPGAPLVASYSADEIGADPTTWIVVQDRDGVLHFGARDLLSYDGDRWRSTSMNGGHAIRALEFSASEDRLWAGAIGEVGWFDRTEVGGWSYHSLNSKLPPEHATPGEVWSVFATPRGAIYVADDKVLRWDGASFRVWSMPGTRRLRALRSNAGIFLQHATTGLYELDESGPRLFLPADKLGGMGVFWIEQRSSGWFLITNRGLYQLADGELKPLQPESSSQLTNAVPTHATKLPDGRFAIGTLHSGVILLEPDGTLHRILGQAEGLPTRLINWLFVDRDKQLWATSYTHISRISVFSTSSVFDVRAALPAKPFNHIVASDGRILAATDDAVYRLNPGGEKFEPVKSLREHISALKVTSVGLLAGGLQSVKVLRGDDTSPYHQSPHDTFALHETVPGRVLIAEGRNLVVREGTAPARTLVSDLPDSAWSIAEDATGRIWLGTETHGILTATPGANDPVKPVAASRLIGRAYIEGKGIARTGTDGSTYLLYSPAAWRVSRGATGTFESVANYPSRTLVAASETAWDGRIWLLHSGGGLAPGVGVITDEGGHPVWRPHSVEGLASIGTPQSIVAEKVGSDETVLWIGGSNGILRHVVDRAPSSPAPRPPLLRAFARNAENDRVRPVSGPLPYSTRSIEFEFAETDFARRSSLRLQTRFVGVDRDWVPADPTSRQTLTAVRDGRYTFQVRAVAETGIASEPATLSFEVLPPWWRTAPALFGAAFAMVPLGYGIYRLRVRSLRRRTVELEEMVRRRTEELERASAAKTQFVANMSHDIRNPLNGIVGLALALEETKLERRQREIVATLRGCTTYLSTLVDDVLDFASIEAGRVELRPRPYAPHELLRSVVTTVKADAAERGAILLVEADPSLPASVLGDAGRIQQILVNYVSNALKYAGGHIRLSTAISSQVPGEIEYSVVDEGPGISSEDKATLFTKFSRLKRARQSDIPGAGLGLAACRLLANIMGGSVGVESEPGRGARFYVRLPLTLAPAGPEVVAPNLPNTTVLVVEDTDYNAWAAAAVLAKLGLSCERARTGAEALRLFSERRFNVVLLDRNLPDMDGTEVARRMRSLESDGLQAVLLAVTAYCTGEDRALCLKAGMDAFVGKPLTPEKLRKVLLATGRRQLAAPSVHIPPDLPTPTYDLSLLRFLSDGSPEGLAAELQRYLGILDASRQRLAALAKARDLPELAKTAHSLVGHAKMIGATALERAAVRLEKASAAGTLAADLLSAVDAEVDRVRAVLSHSHSAGQPA